MTTIGLRMLVVGGDGLRVEPVRNGPRGGLRFNRLLAGQVPNRGTLA